jgi:hypothetical protein
VARARGGVYVHDSKAVNATERAAGWRLRELEHLGLATPAGPSAWTLPADLLDQLEARHRAAPPKHRLFIRKEPLSLAEQIRYLGPVWLDGVEAVTLAPYSGPSSGRRRKIAARRCGNSASRPTIRVGLPRYANASGGR